MAAPGASSGASVEPDSVEGEVLRVEVAENGAMAVRLMTPDGPAWLTHLEPEMLRGIVAVGCHLRAVRVIRRLSSPVTWHATHHTRAMPLLAAASGGR
ncbi:hypothetical protein Cde04nite_36010 [Cellulomonas denverensis]|nr:hypothetical protein Cde04nite_36010 [Cellulomonas denverensis]